MLLVRWGIYNTIRQLQKFKNNKMGQVYERFSRIDLQVHYIWWFIFHNLIRLVRCCRVNNSRVSSVRVSFIFFVSKSCIKLLRIKSPRQTVGSVQHYNVPQHACSRVCAETRTEFGVVTPGRQQRQPLPRRHEEVPNHRTPTPVPQG